MKFKLKLFIVLLAGIALTYTACKKSSTNAAGPALSQQDVASQVAINISQSLFGGLGFDISGGLSAPTSFAVHTQGKVLQSLTNPDCGLVIDTTLSYTGTANGGTASISGTVKFSFFCTNNIVSGFTTNDNLTISLASPDLSFTYKVGENLTLTSLNPVDYNSNLSLSGSLTSDGSYVYNKKSGTSVFNYALTSLIFSPLEGDVVSGSATFNTKGSGPKGVWNYQGTIVFLGNQMAKVTINGTVYTVNLQTGAVS
ncbi:MAG TPA: hypothetical protein VIM16_06105 [Mucilaginibacter sp.]|jgi:hypothetical protein